MSKDKKHLPTKKSQLPEDPTKTNYQGDTQSPKSIAPDEKNGSTSALGEAGQKADTPSDKSEKSQEHIKGSPVVSVSEGKISAQGFSESSENSPTEKESEERSSLPPDLLANFEATGKALSTGILSEKAMEESQKSFLKERLDMRTNNLDKTGKNKADADKKEKGQELKKDENALGTNNEKINKDFDLKTMKEREDFSSPNFVASSESFDSSSSLLSEDEEKNNTPEDTSHDSDKAPSPQAGGVGGGDGSGGNGDDDGPFYDPEDDPDDGSDDDNGNDPDDETEDRSDNESDGEEYDDELKDEEDELRDDSDEEEDVEGEEESEDRSEKAEDSDSEDAYDDRVYDFSETAHEYTDDSEYYDDDDEDNENEEDEEDEADKPLSLKEHLLELRKRVFWMFMWALIGFAVCYPFATEIFKFLQQPLLDALPKGSTFIFTGPSEGFFTELKVAFVAGIFVTSPMIFFQVWRFIAPGLYEEEKMFIAPLAFFSALFFISGATFCYFIAFPFIFKFFMSYSTDFIAAMPSLKESLSFVLQLLLAFGLVFEMPLFVFFLAKLGIVTADMMRSFRRYSIVLIFIVATVLTPPDVFSQCLMAGPMLLLYELSIFVAATFGRKSKASDEKKDEDTEEDNNDEDDEEKNENKAIHS